jgi:hypothetical protein
MCVPQTIGNATAELRCRFPDCFRTVTLHEGAGKPAAQASKVGSGGRASAASSKQTKGKNTNVDTVLDASEIQGKRIAVDASVE